MPLTDLQIRGLRAATRPYKLADGGGLYLLVTPAGGRHWRLAYRFGGKQKVLPLGSYPGVRLIEARDGRDNAKRQLRTGVDPGAQQTAQAAEQQEIQNTFEAVAREWHDNQKAGWVPAHIERILSRFERDVFPTLGTRAIDEIEAPEILTMIQKVEARGALDVSKRIRQSVGAVFRYAIATGRAKRDPTANLRGALKRSPRVQHFAYLGEKDLPEYLDRLQHYDGAAQTRIALQLTMLTMLRTNEVRLGKVDEFEHLDSKSDALWRIPAERMKQGREHLVPLAPQTVESVKQLMAMGNGSPFLLPGGGKDGVISQNTMIFALYRMGYHSRATVHGFRRTASTILNERGYNRDWIEAQLSHSDADEVRSAYNAAEWLPGRREMLAWWANKLDHLRGGAKTIDHLSAIK